MATNGEALADLEDSKRTLEGETSAASGTDLLKLLTAIQHIGDEVGQLEVSTLTDSYVPQTSAFQQATADAKAFVATLESLKVAFAAVATFAAAADKVISYVK